ncbi:MAG: ABC transporter ATP-binding protein, partial [Flammeovirgaceae bacterium]|nr:ABC transporter ATP-binding protein [Flammeovirgaceae bacterium]
MHPTKPQTDQKITLKERLNALQYIPKFFRLVWQTSPSMALSIILLRIAKSLIPLATLYVGKLLLDEVITLLKAEKNADLSYLWLFIGLEFSLSILSDIFSRLITLLDSLL